MQSVGFAGYTIGKLLTHMQQQGFDVLITFDQNLPYQQNASLPVGVVVLVARNNRVQTALAFAPLLLETLKAGQLKQVIRLELAPSV